jgi:hypothetical protein
MSETATKIRRFALSTDSYTPIVAPCACDYLMIANPDPQNAIIRCSDPDNADETWHEIPANNLYWLTAPRIGPPRFQEGEVVTYLKATQGSGPAVVEFLR